MPEIDENIIYAQVIKDEEIILDDDLSPIKIEHKEKSTKYRDLRSLEPCFKKLGTEIYKLLHKPRIGMTNEKGKICFRGQGCVVNAILKQDKIIIRKQNYLVANKLASFTQNSNFFLLKHKNGKTNLYQHIHNRGFLNSTRNPTQFLNSIGIQTVEFQNRLRFVIKKFANEYDLWKNIKKEDNITNILLKICYPVISDFPIFIGKPSHNVIPKVASPYLREGTLKESIKNIFGFSGAKLQKMIYENVEKHHDLYVLSLGNFKGLIPLDYYYELLKQRINLSHINPAHFKQLFRRFSSKKILELFATGSNSNQRMYITDTMRIYKELSDRKMTNRILLTDIKHIGDIHDQLGILFDSIKHETFKIENTAVKEKLLKFEHPNLKIIFPQDTTEIRSWGSKMHHCIGSYADQAAKNQVVLLGIEKDGELKYNISIRGKQLEQFRGFANSNPEEEDRNVLYEFFKSSGIKVDGCW